MPLLSSIVRVYSAISSEPGSYSPPNNNFYIHRRAEEEVVRKQTCFTVPLVHIMEPLYPFVIHASPASIWSFVSLNGNFSEEIADIIGGRDCAYVGVDPESSML